MRGHYLFFKIINYMVLPFQATIFVRICILICGMCTCIFQPFRTPILYVWSFNNISGFILLQKVIGVQNKTDFTAYIFNKNRKSYIIN